ncbi:MAG: hypothetical protein U1F23_09500 [Lysobacterales bacterium]
MPRTRHVRGLLVRGDFDAPRRWRAFREIIDDPEMTLGKAAGDSRGGITGAIHRTDEHRVEMARQSGEACTDEVRTRHAPIR